jgi:YegS/Rv2252/BmrU family lipid kinase
MRVDNQPVSTIPAGATTPFASPEGDERMLFIFNPCSGRNRNSRLLPLLRDAISRRGLAAGLVTTEGPGHATELAREAVAGGCRRVVAVGGDGTMNEVAQALVHSPATLALVPCGSGNGLARHLGIPASPAAALELAGDPEAIGVPIDTGSVNGRPFFNAMGLGLDAEVSQRFNGLTRRGLPAYLRTALDVFFRRARERCTITAGGVATEIDVLLVAVANSDQYGNGAFVAPGARADDGLLDLVAVEPVGAPGALVLGIRLFLGSFDRSRRVHRIQGKHFKIERSSAGIVHTDGEIHHTGAVLDIAVHPASLSVVVARPSRRSQNGGNPGRDSRGLPFALNL